MATVAELAFVLSMAWLSITVVLLPFSSRWQDYVAAWRYEGRHVCRVRGGCGCESEVEAA